MRVRRFTTIMTIMTGMTMTKPLHLHRFMWVCLCVGLLLGAFCLGAIAHPEDEFCQPGGGMDPALCRALQEMDRADAPFLDETVLGRTPLETAFLYVKIGLGHILPGGLDHILFVLALFFSTRRLRPLLWQVSAFTVAHTATLGLAAAGIVSPPASIVEPLIAATIAFVAIENVFFKTTRWWRPFVVFCFGLIHGLGFAGFFGTLGLPEGQFWSALIGFNIGVELGQLAVILAAALLLWPLTKRLSDGVYRALIALPFSLAIGAVGFFWTIKRIFLS